MRWSEVESGGARWSQAERGGVRRSEVESGGARWSEAERGGGRRSTPQVLYIYWNMQGTEKEALRQYQVVTLLSALGF